MREPTKTVACSLWRQQGAADGKRIIPEETAVAFTYDGGTYAVMMATPQNLEDFALGFSVTEGLVCSPADIRHLDIIELDAGIELRMWLTEPHAAALSERRRHLAGPTGCGLCGIESLDEAVRPPARVRDGDIFTPAEIMRALDALAPRQELNRLTRAVHAAAFWQPGTGLVAVREDVGRHNALDKLAGALTRDRVPGHTGLVLLTSRVSVEMVQKTAAIGAPLIVAVSAPTALAVRTAEAAGITLVAVARGDGFEIFTHPQRIKETTKETVINVA
jgi:FdhD protein